MFDGSWDESEVSSSELTYVTRRVRVCARTGLWDRGMRSVVSSELPSTDTGVVMSGRSGGYVSFE
jgi:hypothetical protein